jgi:hypothetical protein
MRKPKHSVLSHNKVARLRALIPGSPDRLSADAQSVWALELLRRTHIADSLFELLVRPTYFQELEVWHCASPLSTSAFRQRSIAKIGNLEQ